MSSSCRNRSLSRTATAALAVTILFALAVALTPTAGAQTYKVLYTFTRWTWPCTGLTMDAAGNFYGTTFSGVVFKLTHVGSGWVFTPLGGPGGSYNILGRVAIAKDGTLYGTALYGYGYCDWYKGGTGGVVFHLTPGPTAPKTPFAPWNANIIHDFGRGLDGRGGPQGDLTFDQAGNIYGTTMWGGCGQPGLGVIYELTPSAGGWTETVLYAPCGDDGSVPRGGVVLDGSGNLWGVYWGTNAVFQLSASGSGWTQTLYPTDGTEPMGGLMTDASGNLYGTTTGGGGDPAQFNGTVFELIHSSGGWTLNTLYVFPRSPTGNSVAPEAKLTMDAAGNLYGTGTYGGVYGYGTVFKLTPSSGGWTYTSLYDFTGGSDGANPMSEVTIGLNGRLYGTASGQYGTNGVVWEITP